MLKTISKAILSFLFTFAAIYCFCVSAKAADVKITFPADRGIFQRNQNDMADITVKAQYSDDAVVKARLDDSETWTELESVGSGNYEGIIENVWSGGWYRLEVAVFDGDNIVSSAELEHVGVGEVFITGGQSNSCNFGGARTQAQNDIVSAFDAAKNTWQHCEDSQPDTSGFATGNAGGSPWPTLGDELVDRLGVPIGFVSTGFGGARIDELETSHYNTIKQAITLLQPYGYRAFLIHQGEADEGTDRTVYAQNYMKLINKTRDDAGYDLVWIVAQVSYAWSNYNNPTRSASITAAQRSICNNYNIFVGPTTDDLLGDYRHTDNLHLSLKGLKEHGKRWADVIVDKLFTGYPVSQADDVENGRVEFDDPEGYPGNYYVSPKFIPDDGYYYVEGSIRAFGEEGKELPTDGDSFTMAAEEVKVFGLFEKLPEHILALGDDIKKAEGADYSAYTDESVAALNAAISDAKTVYANPKATEEETKAAKDMIAQATAALVKKQVPVVNPAPNNGVNVSGNVTDNNTDNSVVVSKVSGIKVKKSGTKAVVTWKKAANAKKYQVWCSLKKNFKKIVKKLTVKSAKATFKNLKKGKTYYFKIRGVNGSKNGRFSAVKKVKF